MHVGAQARSENQQFWRNTSRSRWSARPGQLVDFYRTFVFSLRELLLRMIDQLLRILFFALIVRPLMIIVLGTNIRHQERLPEQGPAIIVANHNSHLDVFALMNVLGLRRLKYVRPVAAADYFMTRPFRRWFSTRIVGIIPIDRSHVRRDHGKHPLEPISEVLETGGIVLLFPEGTRGEPEQLYEFQTGIAHLAKRHPDVSITPVFMRGLGKALPKGEAILVPFFCDVFVGRPLQTGLSKQQFMHALNQAMDDLAGELPVESWT